MNPKFMVTALAIFSLLSFSNDSQARGHGGMKGHKGDHHKRMMKKIMKQVGLSKDQKKKIKGLKQNSRPKIKAAKKEMMSSKKALMKAVVSGQSESSLWNLFDRSFEKAKTLHRLRFEQMLAVRNVMTPEQKDKFRNLLKKHKQKAIKRHQNRIRELETEGF